MNCGCSVTGVLTGGGSICEGETSSIIVLVDGSVDGAIANYSVTITNGITTYTKTRVGAGEIEFNVNEAGTWVITSVDDGFCFGASTGIVIVETLESTELVVDLDNTTLDLCPGDQLNLQVLATGDNVCLLYTSPSPRDS